MKVCFSSEVHYAKLVCVFGYSLIYFIPATFLAIFPSNVIPDIKLLDLSLYIIWFMWPCFSNILSEKHLNVMILIICKRSRTAFDQSTLHFVWRFVRILVCAGGCVSILFLQISILRKIVCFKL